MSADDSPKRHVFVLGMPGDVGGANTECWHTVRLWRQHGLAVTLIPTWRRDERWQTRLEAIGCRIVPSRPDRLDRVPGLPGSVVVSFCNSRFLRCASRLRSLGCRIVWLNCMTWLFADERRHYRRHGTFDVYVFQSDYQQSQLEPQLKRFGLRPEQCHRIRGAFSADEFPFAPLEHAPDEPLVLGRISRADPDKYAADSWSLYGRVRPPVRVRVLGWDPRIEQKLGRPPQWAECLAAGAESARAFYRTVHCLVPLNGGAAENWPRCGLEAMASGVPVVAENRWGWKEMIRHGETGLLWNTPDELVDCIQSLGRDETLRLRIARQARQSLKAELANPQILWTGWEAVCCQLGVETTSGPFEEPVHGLNGVPLLRRSSVGMPEDTAPAEQWHTSR